jgi:hypothetical protein
MLPNINTPSAGAATGIVGTTGSGSGSGPAVSAPSGMKGSVLRPTKPTSSSAGTRPVAGAGAGAGIGADTSSHLNGDWLVVTGRIRSPGAGNAAAGAAVGAATATGGPKTSVEYSFEGTLDASSVASLGLGSDHLPVLPIDINSTLHTYSTNHLNNESNIRDSKSDTQNQGAGGFASPTDVPPGDDLQNETVGLGDAYNRNGTRGSASDDLGIDENALDATSLSAYDELLHPGRRVTTSLDADSNSAQHSAALLSAKDPSFGGSVGSAKGNTAGVKDKNQQLTWSSSAKISSAGARSSSAGASASTGASTGGSAGKVGGSNSGAGIRSSMSGGGTGADTSGSSDRSASKRPNDNSNSSSNSFVGSAVKYKTVTNTGGRVPMVLKSGTTDPSVALIPAMLVSGQAEVDVLCQADRHINGDIDVQQSKITRTVVSKNPAGHQVTYGAMRAQHSDYDDEVKTVGVAVPTPPFLSRPTIPQKSLSRHQLKGSNTSAGKINIMNSTPGSVYVGEETNSLESDSFTLGDPKNVWFNHYEAAGRVSGAGEDIIGAVVAATPSVFLQGVESLVGSQTSTISSGRGSNAEEAAVRVIHVPGLQKETI